MALRKEEFYYDPRERNKMEQDQLAKQQHVSIDLSLELYEQIKVEASQHDQSPVEYIENVLREVISVQPQIKHINPEAVEQLKQIQDQIFQEHGGKLFEDSIEMLHEEREKRDRELGL